MVKVNTNIVESLDLERTTIDTSLVSQLTSIAAANIVYTNTLSSNVFTEEEVVGVFIAADFIADYGIEVSLNMVGDILIGLLTDKGHSLYDANNLLNKHIDNLEDNNYSKSLDKATLQRRKVLNGKQMPVSLDRNNEVFYMYNINKKVRSKYDYSSFDSRVKALRKIQVITKDKNGFHFANSFDKASEAVGE